jgi:hypothetical protein
MEVEYNGAPVDGSLVNLKSVQKIHGAEFIVDIKYRIIAPIGKGSYGMVWYDPMNPVLGQSHR